MNDEIGRDEEAGRPEGVGIGGLELEFIHREDELAIALDHVDNSSAQREPGHLLLVSGDSGTGKSFFVKELLWRAHQRNPEGLFLYADVSNDGFQSARTVGSLLQLALIPGPMLRGSPVSVPVPLSLEHLRRKRRRSGFGRGLLRAIAGSVGALFGAGSGLSAVIGSGEDRQSLEEELAAYLSWVSRRQQIVLAIDNVQFLNVNDRLAIESIAQRVGTRISLVAIDRTNNGGSELDPPFRCFPEHQMTIALGGFSKHQTESLVHAALPQIDTASRTELASDVFTKSRGLPKDIEYCLRQYVLEAEQASSSIGVEGLLSTIDRLPLIHRSFLIGLRCSMAA